MIQLISALLRILQILLFVDLMLEWFPVDRNSRSVRFMHAVTVPLLMPFRLLLDRIAFLRKIPFDFSYVVAFLLLELIIQLIV